jgi:hypothetical protein
LYHKFTLLSIFFAFCFHLARKKADYARQNLYGFCIFATHGWLYTAKNQIFASPKLRVYSVGVIPVAARKARQK